MDINQEIQDERITSDEEFSDENDSESSTDIDAKLAEDDVFDIEFLKCYSALKKKDEKIYDQNIKFFDDKDDESDQDTNNQALESSGPLSDTKRKKPRLTLLDHQLSLRGDEVDELRPEETKIDLNKEISKSYYEKELDEIKKSIEEVAGGVDSESDDEFLVVKNTDSKTSKAKSKINDILTKIEDDDETELKHLKEIWSEPKKLSEEDRFLRDYILNKRYLPKDPNDQQPNDDDDENSGFFSKNLANISEADDREESLPKANKFNRVEHHSDEKDFDKISRIPRNATKTIRDLDEKRAKKEKRMKKLEKKKKLKKKSKDADYEDLVGDLQTKFHYQETEPNDYGLSAEELLMATDEELEKWMKLVDVIRAKSPGEEESLRQRYERNRNDLDLKKSIFTSIYSPETTDTKSESPNDESKKLTRSKRKRKDSDLDSPQKSTSLLNLGNVEEEPLEGDSNSLKKKKKKHKRGQNHKKFAKVGVAPDRLLAYGLSKTKLKKSNLL